MTSLAEDIERNTDLLVKVVSALHFIYGDTLSHYAETNPRNVANSLANVLEAQGITISRE